MIRSLSSIYAQAHIPRTEREKRSFINYILCFCEFTHLHHVGVSAPEISALTLYSGGKNFLSRMREAGAWIDG